MSFDFLSADSGPAQIERYLRQNSHAKQSARVAKRGVPGAKILGSPKPIVKQVASALGKNQPLAESLWSMEIHEIRLLAIWIAEPAKMMEPIARNWINELWSWDMADHLARYLLPDLVYRHQLIHDCAREESLYAKRLAFSGIACSIQRHGLTADLFENYCHQIELGSSDKRNHVRKAVVWALVEVGKVNDLWQEQAILFASELEERGGNVAWVGRHARKELEELVSVPERKRLLSRKSKTGRKTN